MAKLTLNDITSGYASTTALNDNFNLIETALENTLSRDGTTPNSMSADLDMNGNGILNVGSLTVGGVDVTTLTDGAVAAAASAAAALVSETNAAASEVAAEAAASGVVGWEYAGTWTNNTPYLKNNIVYSSTLGDGYICITSHTSNAAGTISDDIANWGLLVLHAVATGSGDMYLADNLAGLANYTTARSNMGLTIGSHVQAYNANLTSLTAFTTDTDVSLAANSDVKLATQKATKTYADTKVGSVTGTAPVVSSGGTTPTISMPAATASVNGYMTSTYAAKLDGIAAGATVGVPMDVGAGGVGMMAEMLNYSAGTLTSGATISGAYLRFLVDGANSGVPASGTWRNITATSIAMVSTGTFQRIA